MTKSLDHNTHAPPEEALPRQRALECGSGAACTAATGQRLAAPSSADKRCGAAVGGRNLPQEVVWHQTPDAVHIRVVFATLRDIQAGALRLKQDEASLQFSFTEIGEQSSGEVIIFGSIVAVFPNRAVGDTEPDPTWIQLLKSQFLSSNGPI
jgi:hypothetical protein